MDNSIQSASGPDIRLAERCQAVLAGAACGDSRQAQWKRLNALGRRVPGQSPA
jgi:hypothetical protein